MPELELLNENDPILRQVAYPIHVFTDDLKDTLIAMQRLCSARKAAGLAANQVGILRRLVIVKIRGQYRQIVNPEIISKKGQFTHTEGCLSLPGRLCGVQRAKHVTVRGRDCSGNLVVYDAAGQDAAAVQHEVDHLNGLLITEAGWELKNLSKS